MLFRGLALDRAIGVDVVHVAYEGGAAMINDLMSGQIACGMDAHIELTPLHQVRKIRILAPFMASLSNHVHMHGYSHRVAISTLTR